MNIHQLFHKENLIRYKKLLILAGVLIAALGVRLYDCRYCGQLDTQQLASRWSGTGKYVQLSVFFEQEAGLEEGEVYPLRNQLMEAVEEAASDMEADGRLLVDAYSTEGELSLSSKQADTSVRAYGVSKDFFLFHPLELLSGSYFTSEDELADGIILDELTAWKLFGAVDVAGMTVNVNGDAYIIRGVVRTDEGHFSEASLEAQPSVYVDYDILKQELGADNRTIDSYELLIANPVKDFGKTKLAAAIGRDEATYELVDNTNRFSWSSRAKRLLAFGTRSMKTTQMVYPYWENRAKGYEDVADLLMVIELLLLVYPFIFAIKMLVICVKWLKMKKGLYKDKNIASLFGKFLVQCRRNKFVKKNTKE
jgi:hypothetical protein